MQKWAVFHLISKHSLNINISFVFSLWIINEFEKFILTLLACYCVAFFLSSLFTDEIWISLLLFHSHAKDWI